MKHTATKRMAAWLLALCLLLGMLPAPATAAETGAQSLQRSGFQLYEVNLKDADQAKYHHGDGQDSWDAGSAGSGRGAYCEADNIAVTGDNLQGMTIKARERARFKNADYLLQPFDLVIGRVPAYSACTVTFTVDYSIKRNSKGNVWYWLELLNGTYGTGLSGYNTQNNSSKSNNYSVGRVSFSNKSGGSARFTFTVNVTNTTGGYKDITQPMAYYAGASRSGSGLSSYHHQTESSICIAEKNAMITNYVAKVENEFFSTLDDAVSAYNNTSGATLTLLQNISGTMALTEPGTVELNSQTLTGAVRAGETSGIVTVKNGTVSSQNAAAVAHTGRGTLELINMTATASGSNYYGVNNQNGTLTLNANVTIDGGLYAGGERVSINGGGPTITNGNEAQIYLSTPLTLGSGLNSTYRLKLTGAAAADTPITVTTNVEGISPEGRFTDVNTSGSRHFFAEDGKVVARPYKVTFDANGGTVTPAATYAKSDRTAAIWPTPVKNGCRFVGWFPSTESGSEHGNYDFTADTTLYAHWENRQITVTLDANGGSVPSGSIHAFYNQAYPGLPTPARDHYTFDGWYTAASGGTKVESSTTVTRTEDHILYAHWTRNEVIVTFDYDYIGAPTIPSRTVNAGDKVGPLPFRSRTGYTLEGWYTERGGAGTEITAATTVSAAAAYYAHWTADAYRVTYDFNGGTGEGREGQAITGTFLYIEYGKTYGVGSNAVIENCNPTRTGHALDGWYTAKAGGAKVEDTATMDKIYNHTLYAHWTAKPCAILYNANGGKFAAGSGDETDKVYGSGQKCGQSYNFPDPPRQDGHTFIGWFTAAAGGTQVTAGTVCGSESQELYAHWSVNHEHNVGGTAGSANFAYRLTTGSLDGTDPSLNSVITRSSSMYTLDTGNYYLDGNITDLDRRIKIADGATVNLCLNGCTISASALNYCVLNVGYRATLNVCDCQGTGAVKNDTSNANSGCLYANGPTALYGGTFTSSPGAYCATAQSLSRLTVDGAMLIASGSDYYALRVCTTATIISGRLEGPLGVEVDKGGTLNVSGGSITGTKGSGIGNSGTVIMTGGTATSTSTGFSCHGIENRTGASLTVTGGSVSGNGYGIRAVSNFTLSGSPIIVGNETDYSDIYLGSGAAVTAGTEDQALTGVYSVKTAGTPTANAPIPITTAAGADHSGHFTSSDFRFSIRNSGMGDGQVVQLCEPHIHKLCGTAAGTACAHTGDAHSDTMVWTGLAQASGALPAGNYYLAEDVGSADAPANPQIDAGTTVNLCLNGHTLTGTLSVSGTLNLCDCSTDTSKKGAVTNSTTAVMVNSKGVFNQYGGTLSALEYPVDPQSGSLWNFYRGELASTKTDGAAPEIEPWGQVNLLGGDGAININGGSIGITNTDSSRTTPVHMGAVPATPYNVRVIDGDNAYPITVADGLPESTPLNSCFHYTGIDMLKLAAADGQVVLRGFRADVKETQDGETRLTLTASTEGRLTAGQLAAPWVRVGYAWDGYYSTADKDDAAAYKFTTDKVFTNDTTMYPHWTECGHTHSGDDADKTTVASTCTEKGTDTFTCATCQAAVTRELDLAAHTYDGTWTTNGDNHWHQCTVCGYHNDEAGHNWDEGDTTPGETEDTVAYSCTCGAARMETIQKYRYTFETDAYSEPKNQIEQASAVRAGVSISLPGIGVARTGYQLDGWVLLDDTGIPFVKEDGTENVLTGAFEMPARNVTFQVRWQMESPFELADGQTMVLEDGTKIEKTTGQTVTVTQPDTRDESGAVVPGQKTVITLPAGETDVTINAGENGGKDKITVPAGSTVATTSGSGEQGPTITIGGGNEDGTGSETGAVDTSGGVDAPVGSIVTTTDKDGGATTVTITNGNGHIGSDGNVTFPPAPSDPSTGGGTVKVEKPDGQGGTVTETVAVGGDTEGLDTETASVPENVPENNRVQVGNATIVLPVDPATGDTDPATGGVTENEDGSINVPAGSQVELTDEGGNRTIITLPAADSGVTMDDATGEINLPDGSKVVTGGQEFTVTGKGVIVTSDGKIKFEQKEGSTAAVKVGVDPELTFTWNGSYYADDLPTIAPDNDNRLNIHGCVMQAGNNGPRLDVSSCTVDPATGSIAVNPNGYAELIVGTGAEEKRIYIENPDENSGTFEVVPSQDGTIAIPPEGRVHLDGYNHGTIALPTGGTLGRDGTTVTCQNSQAAVIIMKYATATVTAPASGSFTVDKDVTVINPAAGTAISYESGGTSAGKTVTTAAGITYYTVQFVEETVGHKYHDVQAVQSGEKAAKPATPAENDMVLYDDGGHYQFIQWNDGDGSHASAYNFEEQITGPVAVYAYWDKAPHTSAGGWEMDGNYHWKICTLGDGCTEEVDRAPHNANGTGGACSVCGYRQGGGIPVGPGPGAPSTPAIEQPGHGNVTVSPANPQPGDEVTITVTPESGYQPETIAVTDSNGKPVEVTKNPDGTYTFIQPEGEVTISVTLGLACLRDDTCPIHAFTDASTTAWYHDGVHYCVENGLMLGYGNGKFGPDNTLTRGMVAQILYNKEGKPNVMGLSPFEDVTEGDWYADAVIWAAENHIVTGYGNSRYGPNNPVTREQLATILWRYAGSPEGTGNLDSFTDGAEISDWAAPALQWAVEQKIVAGKGNGILDPGGKATRAEVATMLM